MTQSLTEGTVLNRTRASCLEDVTQLNCWGCNLKDCKLLERMPNLKVLSVSSNALQNLRDFACCHNLHELYVRNNDIRHLDEIYWLKDLPFLHTLWLEGNPCVTSSPFDKQRYRDIVLKHLPQLKVLDQTSFVDEDHVRVHQVEHQLPDYSTSPVILKALSLRGPDDNVVAKSSSSSSNSSVPGSCRSVPEKQKQKHADQFFVDLTERLQQVKTVDSHADESSSVGRASASGSGLGRRAASARQSARSARGEQFFLDISAKENKIVKDSPSTPASDQTYTARENSATGVEVAPQPDNQFSRDYERLKREYKERQLQQYQLEHLKQQQEFCRPSSPSMVEVQTKEKFPSPSRESNSTTIADFYESEQFEDFSEPDGNEVRSVSHAKPQANHALSMRSSENGRPSLSANSHSRNKYATFTRNGSAPLGEAGFAPPAVSPQHKPIMLQTGRTPPTAEEAAHAPNMPTADSVNANAGFSYTNFRPSDEAALTHIHRYPENPLTTQQNGPSSRLNGVPPISPRDSKQLHRRRIYSTGMASVTASPTSAGRRPTQLVNQHQPFQRFQPMYQSMNAAAMGSTQSSPLRKPMNGSGHHQSNGNLSSSTGGGRRSPWQMTENEYRLRAANVLTAVLSLVRDLDYDSLRIVDQEIRSKIQQAAAAAQQQAQMAAIDSGDDMATPSAALMHDFFGQHAANRNRSINGQFLDESNA